jgi:hypothetical protein
MVSHRQKGKKEQPEERTDVAGVIECVTCRHACVVAGFINSPLSKSEPKMNIGSIKNVSKIAHILRWGHTKSIVRKRTYSPRIVHPEVKTDCRWVSRVASSYRLFIYL